MPNNVQQLFKRMSPAPPVVPGRTPPAAPQQRGTSPVNGGRQPMVVQNGPQVSHVYFML